MMIQKKLMMAVLGAALGFFSSGCIATSREMINLRDDISQLQGKINDLQQNQADLSVKMDYLVSKLDPLSAQLQETQSRMVLLGQRLDDMESGMTTRMNMLSEKMSGSALPATPSPSQMYQAAYADYSAAKYELAAKGFAMYLGKYPASEMAPNAQYYLGECYFSQKDLENSLQSFQGVQKRYPKSSFIPAAMLKEGLTLELMGKATDASHTLGALVKAYPGSPEASIAREKIKARKHNAK